MNLLNFVRLWDISEEELEEEIQYLKEKPEYKKNLSATDDSYAKTLRKLAEMTIVLWRLCVFLILLIIAIIGIYTFFQHSDFNWKRIVRLMVYTFFSGGVFIVPVRLRIRYLRGKL